MRIFWKVVVRVAPVLLFVNVTVVRVSYTPFSMLAVMIPSITSFSASYVKPGGKFPGLTLVTDQPLAAASAVTPKRDLNPGIYTRSIPCSYASL